MDQTDLWSTHLRPGERLVWQAEASEALRGAEVVRRRIAAGLIGLVCLVLALAFAGKALEVLPGAQPPGLAVALVLPLYVALALVLILVFIVQLGRLNPKLTRAVHYAATDARILAADAQGALLDEIDVQEIAGFIPGGRRSAPDIFVLRTHDDLNVRAFAIEHIDRPLEAKAILEDHLQPAAEETP